MKKLLQEMLFLDEKTDKFSTTKFMMLVTFYFLLFLNARALYLDRELKNASVLQEMLMITSGLYFGRRFNFKTKNMEVNGDKDGKQDAIN